jgi:predicted TIM-barrel fold metal-dependent hydrolase
VTPNYFDANAMIGAHFAPRQGRFDTADDLLAEMDRFGIAEALVHHGLAKEYDLDTGNAALTEAVRGHPRLRPCWMIGLQGSTAHDYPRRTITRALAEGVRAVRLLIGGYLGDAPLADALAYARWLDALDAHRIPLFMDAEGGWGPLLPGLTEILEQHPVLPIIIATFKFDTETRLIYARMERFANLHLEISGIQGNGMIEDLVRHFGPTRLVFGSRFPFFSPGSRRIGLAYAEIDDTTRAAIAGDNLRRMMAAVRT